MEWETTCLQTDQCISQTTLLVLPFQVSKCGHPLGCQTVDAKEGNWAGEPLLCVCTESEIPLPQNDEAGCLPLRSGSMKVKISVNYSEYKNYPWRAKKRAWLEEQEG